MSFTRLDCAFVKGEFASSDSAFSCVLNPNLKPGTVCIGGSLAARESIGGHVASKLALEHFVEESVDFFRVRSNGAPALRDTEIVTEENLRALEAAFKRANSSVYNFGHRLAAGGRMAASLIGAILQDDTISVGRVGSPTAYLCRGGELYPFFDVPKEMALGEKRTGNFVGVASLVSVQLSSLALEEKDILLFVSDDLSEGHLNRLFQVLNDMAQGIEFECDDVLRRLFPKTVDIDFAIVVQVGADAIFLHEEVV